MLLNVAEAFGMVGQSLDMKVHFGLTGTHHVLQQHILVQLLGIVRLHLCQTCLEVLNLVLQVGHLRAQADILLAQLIDVVVVGRAGELFFKLSV